MIRFALSCGRGHEFDAWFRNSRAYDEQVERGSLACPICGADDVKKAIMAPAIARGSREVTPEPRPETAAQPPAPNAAPEPALLALMSMLRAVRQHVESNFEHVGEQFPEEARKIHFGEADPRDIYGQASKDEVEALLEEGVEIRPLPWVPKLDS